MPIVAVALLLAAAVAHATWNYVAKGAQSSASFMFVFCTFAAIAWMPLAVGVFLWTQPSLGWDALLFVAVSGALNALYFFLLTEGYRYGDLSLVYPLARGTGPALSVVGAILIFGERPSWLALAGSALVVAGIIVMSWSPGRSTGAEVRRSIIFALATGACIAAYTLWDNKGVTILTPILYSSGLDISRSLILAPFALISRAGRAEVGVVLREQRVAVMAIGILSPGAYILVLVALTLAPVSYVAPAREIGSLFGVVLGARSLAEADPARRSLAALLMVGGVIALALG